MLIRDIFWVVKACPWFSDITSTAEGSTPTPHSWSSPPKPATFTPDGDSHGESRRFTIDMKNAGLCWVTICMKAISCMSVYSIYDYMFVYREKERDRDKTILTSYVSARMDTQVMNRSIEFCHCCVPGYNTY
jgi:hypothetical protein